MPCLHLEIVSNFVKFPHYRNKSLFIVGESYAGHYVPQLAELMLEFNKKEKLFNLKGIARQGREDIVFGL
ncbi:hypothetical protein S83_012272, partial [Arachis hypogaea]